MIIFLKAAVTGGAASDLFDTKIEVAGYTTKDGTYIAPHQAIRKKKRTLVRPISAAKQGDLFGGSPGPAPAKVKPASDRQRDMFASLDANKTSRAPTSSDVSREDVGVAPTPPPKGGGDARLPAVPLAASGFPIQNAVEGHYKDIDSFEAENGKLGNIAQTAMAYADMSRKGNDFNVSLRQILDSITDKRRSYFRMTSGKSRYASDYADVSLAATFLKRSTENNPKLLDKIRGPWALVALDEAGLGGVWAKHPHMAIGDMRKFAKWSRGYKARRSNAVKTKRGAKPDASADQEPSREETPATDKPIAWGVPAGTSKADRRVMNTMAAALLSAKAGADMTAEDRQVLAHYTGRGGIGDSLNEFYTDPAVAASMWSILANCGIDGGDVLEPSCGTGAFAHTAPDGARVVGVEMDATSARIAGILHGARHEVSNSSLERFATQDGRQFDAVIGNVPFGLRGATIRDDKPDLTTAEQYFVDTALDKAKDGGVVALIVPTGIMDSSTGRAFRERIMRKAGFLGAHRLPNTAFEAAHTGVTTDIVVFRKRPQEVAGALSTLSQDQLRALGVWDAEFLSGDYFTGSGAANVMGRMEEGWRAKAGMGHDITVNGSMHGVPEALARWSPAAAAVVNPELTVERILASLGDDAKAKRAAVNGAIKTPYQVAKLGDVRTINGVRYVLQGEPPRWHRADGETLAAVEDAHRIGELLDDLTEGRTKDRHHARAQLSEALDDYVKEHGLPARNKDLARWLSAPSMAMTEGASPAEHAERVKGAQRRVARLLGAVNDDGSYSDLVTGRDRAGESAALDTVATKLSLETGGFTVDQLSAAWGKGDRDAVTDHLFASPGYAVLPDGQTWTTLDSYLSGDLWDKLDQARAAAGHEGLAPEYRGKYAAQAAALEAAIAPQSLEDVEILVTSGFVTPAILTAWFTARRAEYQAENQNASWAPGLVNVSYQDGWWDLRADGTGGNWDADLVGKMLNRHGVRKDDLPKVERLNQEFREWLLSAPVRDQVEEAYNRSYRGFRAPAYSDAPIAIPGLNPALNVNGYHFAGLRWALEAGKGIIAADVGLGKTGRGLMLARLARATGQAKKPTFVVPKSVLANWLREAEFWFPGSRCLVIGETYATDKKGNVTSRADDAATRRRKYQDMQQNDYDFVFISQPAWNDLDVDPITKGQYANGDFWTKRGDKLGNAGDKRLNQIRTAYDEALAKREFRKREDTAYFGDLGIDMLILDEGHAFKNLYAAKNRFGASPKFLGGSGLSNRAQDTYFKTRQLREANGGKGVFMLTATPTKNSPLEVYSMLSHIAPEAFERMGIKNSEDFLDRFCEFKNDTILTVDGKIEDALVTAGFKNLNELREVMKRYIDRTTADDVGLGLPGRDDRQHLVDMTAEQEAVYQELRAAAAENDRDDTGEAHIFSIMSKMGKASIDLSLLGAQHSGVRSPKIEAAARQVVEGAREGGQIVFCDHVDVHEKIAAELVRAGIPREQIGIINATAAASSAARQKISDDFNAGRLKVVIGNTATMGEGINLQQGTTDIHHLDLPWEPASMQQRNGRGLRQGNIKEAVRIHTYLAKGSFDGYRYQTIQSKRDWQDLLWNGGDRVENLAREGAFSRQDMLIMLSANPEQAKAKYDADRVAAAERKAVEDRGKAIEMFGKFQEIRRSLAKMKQDGIEGAAFDRARARSKKLKETLRDAPAFPAKHLLDSDAPALIEPVTGHAYTAGQGFETLGGPDCPIGRAGKWVVTDVDRANGAISARGYGPNTTAYPMMLEIATLKSGVVPFAYSEAAEAAEVAEHAARAASDRIASGKVRSVTDLSGLPDHVIESNRDHYLSVLKQSMLDYKNGDGFSHVPLVDRGGNVSLHVSYDARKHLDDHDVMLPTAANRAKAIDAYVENEMAKRDGKEYASVRGKTVPQLVVQYPAVGHEKPRHNPWSDIIKRVFGDHAVKEAEAKYRDRLQAVIDAAPTHDDAKAVARQIAPQLQYGNPQTILTHPYAVAALAKRAARTEGGIA